MLAFMFGTADNQEQLRRLEEFESAVIRMEAQNFENELDLNVCEEYIKQLYNYARLASPAAFRLVSDRFYYTVYYKRRVFRSAVSVSNIEILRDVKRLLEEEIARTNESHDELRAQTDNLQKIGFTADRIAAVGAEGYLLTYQVRRIEARDQLIVWTLFGVFVFSSVWIVGKRIKRVIGWLAGLIRAPLHLVGLM